MEWEWEWENIDVADRRIRLFAEFPAVVEAGPVPDFSTDRTLSISFGRHACITAFKRVDYDTQVARIATEYALWMELEPGYGKSAVFHRLHDAVV